MSAAAEKKQSPAEQANDATAAIALADARREHEAILPPPEELFPALHRERVEFYMTGLHMACSDMTDSGRFFWRALESRERVYLCRLAGVARELATCEWKDLPLKDRARLIARFMWLREWVLSIQSPLPAYIPEVLIPEEKPCSKLL